MQKIKKFLFQNTSAKQTVAKNTFWLMVGEVIARLFKLATIVFATRKLGVEGWGVFSYALAFVSFFFILSDLGVNTFITREMSKESNDRYRYLSPATIIKFALMLLFFIASLILAPHLGNIHLGMEMITVISIFSLSDGLKEFVLSINRSFERMEREAFSKIIGNCVIMVAGFILLIDKATPLSLAIAYASGSLISSAYIFWSLRKELSRLTFKITKNDFKIIYDFSWPLIIIGLFSFIFNIDNIMLGQIKSAADVGLYAAGQRLVQFTSIIPSFMAISLFPILSKHENNTEKTTNIFEKTMTIILALGIPLAIAGFLLRERIIVLIFGSSYLPGALAFGILTLSILASFPNIFLSNVIFSKNLQRIFIKATIIGVVVNIVLNFALIPTYGATGAAISTTVTQLLITVINWRQLKKYVQFNVFQKLGKIFVANVVMTIMIILCLQYSVHLVIIVALALTSYGATLLLLKERIINDVRTALVV